MNYPKIRQGQLWKCESDKYPVEIKKVVGKKITSENTWEMEGKVYWDIGRWENIGVFFGYKMTLLQDVPGGVEWI